MNILSVVLLALVSFMIFNLLKIFVLSKLKINKWIIFLLLMLVSFSIFFIPKASFILYAVQLLYFILIIWFVDVFMDDRKEKLKKKNQKVIQNKPKPKQNRIKD